LEITVVNIIDARCNHEVKQAYHDTQNKYQASPNV